MLARELPTGLITIDGFMAPRFGENLACEMKRAKRSVTFIEPSGETKPSSAAYARNIDATAIVSIPRTWTHNQALNFECEGIVNIRACSETRGIVVGEYGCSCLGQTIEVGKT